MRRYGLIRLYNTDGRSVAMQQLNDGRGRFDRRAFCKAAVAATAVGVVEASLGSALARADLTQEQRDKMTADEIIQQMKAGNERFRSGKPQHRDLMREAKATAKGQYPAAIVFGCVDSRTPAELLLDLGIGYIFCGRVAGNVADEDILGSMEFACKVAGAKVVLVMGHTSCGAIKGAIDGVKLGNLTGLLAKISPAVEATTYKGIDRQRTWLSWTLWRLRMWSSRLIPFAPTARSFAILNPRKR